MGLGYEEVLEVVLQLPPKMIDILVKCLIGKRVQDKFDS